MLPPTAGLSTEHYMTQQSRNVIATPDTTENQSEQDIEAEHSK